VFQDIRLVLKHKSTKIPDPQTFYAEGSRRIPDLHAFYTEKSTGIQDLHAFFTKGSTGIPDPTLKSRHKSGTYQHLPTFVNVPINLTEVNVNKTKHLPDPKTKGSS